MQTLINAAWEEVESRYGDEGERTIRLRGKDARVLYPDPPIATGPAGLPTGAVTIVERSADGTTVGTLTASEYRVMDRGRSIERIFSTGVTENGGRWADLVDITYTPIDESDLRTTVVFDLVRLSVEYNGLASERIGDYQSQSADYLKERERILRQVGLRRATWFA
jgi:hypothetical protein